MQGRTCILVSHNVALTVQNAAWVVVLENGRVKNQGTTDVLLESGDLGDDELVKTSVMNSRSQSTTNLQSLDDKNADMKAKAAAIESKLNALAKPDEEEEPVKTDGKLVEEESKAEGVVGSEVYFGYAKILWWLANMDISFGCFPSFSRGLHVSIILVKKLVFT